MTNFLGNRYQRPLRAVMVRFPRTWKVLSVIRRFVGGIRRYEKLMRKDASFRNCSLAARYYETEDVKPNWILYESYNGRDFGCNPYAIFVYLLEHPDFQHLHHYIAVDDLNNPMAQRYVSHPRVTLLKSHSKDFIRVAESCKYYINNVSFKPYLIKKEGQIYVTTWHSTLLKKLAHDCDRPWEGKNVARALLASDYFVSPNRYTTHGLFSSHGVDQWFSGVVLETGYPRNDLLYSPDADEFRKRLGISPDTKLVLYAPTWRGSYHPKNTVKDTLDVVRYLRDHLPDNFRVVAKFHTMVYRFLDEEALQFAAPRDIDTNAILGATDILITDYSGIFFDYLITGRPIIYFVPDRSEYETEKNGFYLDLDTLPGPVHQDLDSVVSDLINTENVTRKYSRSYKDFQERFVSHDDGRATERVVNVILKDASQGRVSVFTSDHRHEILLYPSNLAGNGVTESFIALLDNIDYQRFKVAVMLPSDGKYRQAQIRLNKNVSIFYQNVPDALMRTEYACHQVLMRWGVSKGIPVPEKAYKRTMRRMFAGRSFETVVNFNGYFPGAALKLAVWAESGRKVIYLHNDLEEDRKIKHPQLHAVFSTYSRYDELFCVSADSLDANREKISKYVSEQFGTSIAGKFSFCMNPIDPDMIRERAAGGHFFRVDSTDYIAIGTERGFIRGVPYDRTEKVKFISVGRLSPEKNHQRLLEAFKDIVNDYDNVFLYIVGTGPLEGQLRNKVTELGLSDRVAMTGFIQNPLPLVQACDCFVLSSDIEGQPITVLEALTLGVPVISTDISGPRGLLDEFGGLLVDRNAEGIAMGMRKFLTGEWGTQLPNQFNEEAYVERAMLQFYERVVRAPRHTPCETIVDQEVQQKFA